MIIKKTSLKPDKMLILLLSLIIVSCQNSATTNNTPKENVSKSPASSTSINTTNIVNTVTPTTIDIDDEQAINDLLKNNSDFFPTDVNGDEEDLKATVPNNGGVVFATVPNNGGVVFVADSDSSNLSTKALISPVDLIKGEILKVPLKTRVKEIINRLKTIIPTNWSKKLIGVPKRAVDIKFNSTKTKADVTVKTTYMRELIFRKDNGDLNKRINEESIVKSVFIKEKKTWKLEQISPIDLRINNDMANLAIESITISINSKDKSITSILDLTGLKNQDNLLSLNHGDILTLEVKATNKDDKFDPPIHAFVRVPNIKFRIPLLDDGSQDDLRPKVAGVQISGDKNQDDDIYTTNIVIKQNIGINYLTIDLIAGGSFDNNTNGYNSISKSIPIIIK